MCSIVFEAATEPGDRNLHPFLAVHLEAHLRLSRGGGRESNLLPRARCELLSNWPEVVAKGFHTGPRRRVLFSQFRRLLARGTTSNNRAARTHLRCRPRAHDALLLACSCSPQPSGYERNPAIIYGRTSALRPTGGRTRKLPFHLCGRAFLSPSFSEDAKRPRPIGVFPPLPTGFSPVRKKKDRLFGLVLDGQFFCLALEPPRRRSRPPRRGKLFPALCA